MLTERDWIWAYQTKGAFWMHDGNPKRPHALLTSGQHSNGFFNSSLVTEDNKLLNKVCSNLTRLFVGEAGREALPDRMVGPATGATRLAEIMSSYVNAHQLPGKAICSWASPEKEGQGEERKMVFKDSKRQVLPGEKVLLCEDVISTGGSVELTARASAEKGGIVLPFVLVLVNRSGQEEVAGRKIISLISRHMPKWAPAECPLCPLASEAIRPKGENWALLTQNY